jgi:hypothetical protein
MTAPVVSVGLTAVVLRDRMERLARKDPDNWPEQKVQAWLARTDYAWVCSADTCQYIAGVMYKTVNGARKAAAKHAGEHSGATVEQI